MQRNRTNGFALDVLWLALGAASYALVGWRWSAPAAAWIAPVFLVRFFRNQDRWCAPVLAWPFLYAALAVNMIGAWDLPAAAQAALPAVLPLPLIAVLYLDRALSPRLPGGWATLVLPAATVCVDYLLGFTPLGTLFSAASTQFGFTTIVQMTSLTGIWGVSFLIAWFAAVLNAAWERRFDLRAAVPEEEIDRQKSKSWLPVQADGIIRTVRTPYGTLAAAICFDLDFPGFMRQAARAGTDILLVPGYDSRRIRPFHSEPALLRGVEGGYSVVRQANEGTSTAADWRGTVLARQDFFGTADRLMLADVPVRGRRTLYGILGDWLAWAAIALLGALAAVAALSARAPRRRATRGSSTPAG